MNKQSLLNNEEGSVIVAALMILVLVTLMGISATTTSTIEAQIAGNEYIYKKGFYLAEASVQTAAQQLENMSAGQLYSGVNWINTTAINPDAINLSATIWENTITTIPNTQFSMVETTGFIDLTEPSNLHTYTVFGVYGSPSGGIGQVVIEIGYKKRF